MWWIFAYNYASCPAKQIAHVNTDGTAMAAAARIAAACWRSTGAGRGDRNIVAGCARRR